MSKAAKVWLIVAGCLTALGILIFTGAMAMNHWHFPSFNNKAFVTKTYEVNGSFDSISVDVSTSDIYFVLSDDGKCKVECYDSEKMDYSASVQWNTLTITSDKEKERAGRLTFFAIESPKITVYLPEEEYQQLSIVTHTGDVTIPKDFSFAVVDIDSNTSDLVCAAAVSDSLKFRSSTGDASLSSLSANNIDIAVTTGDILLQDVSASGNISIKTTTGDVSLNNTICEKNLDINGVTCDVVFENSDAAQITATVVTGDITGTLRSDKDFITKANVGDVDVPDPAEGGKCLLTTNVGDIRIKIVKNDISPSTPDSATKDEA